MSDAARRRMDRAAQGIAACREDRKTTPLGVAAFLELEDGKATRPYLEYLATTRAWPEWPVWPPEADGWHHRWVREHWTPEAAEDFDFLHVALSAVNRCAAEVLADEVYAGESLADAFTAAGLDAPPADYAGTARDHLEATRGAHAAETFDRHLAKVRDFGAKWPTQPPAFREMDRRFLAEATRKYTDPTDDERARMMERSPGLGIRGEGHDWRLTIPYYADLAKAAGDLASR